MIMTHTARGQENSLRREYPANCSAGMPNTSATACFISEIDGDGMQVLKSRHMPFWLLAFFLFTSPALSGTVTCAGKTYKDVTYAKFTSSGYFGIVNLWIGETRDETPNKTMAAKYTVIINTDTMCEFVDVQPHIDE
jgi:hypothetical protein